MNVFLFGLDTLRFLYCSYCLVLQYCPLTLYRQDFPRDRRSTRPKVREIEIALRHMGEAPTKFTCNLTFIRVRETEGPLDRSSSRPKVRETESELGFTRPKARETESELECLCTNMCHGPNIIPDNVIVDRT